MKRFIIILSLLFATVSFAEDAWPRTFFGSVGMGLYASKGDLNERVLSLKDTSGKKQTIHSPALNIFASPDFTIGVNVREFTIDLNFQIWESEQVINGFPDESVRGNSLYWRISMEFIYNLFWPEFFQVGLGGSLSYTTLTTDNTAYSGDEVSESEFMGSSIGFIANIKYYVHDNIAIVPYAKIYENWFRNVYTEASGLCDLDSYMWQTFFFVGVSVQFQF
ncbi:MAG: hypothetical protein II850_01740 [Fibrobacter sp.]|jgi:hypothetical protein|uniref:hypothetical protein n=1 Tax=Fibrobacter sp. UWCM TaxID=1896208 RepID=UPI00091E0C30|nr:hypothetical protein [Fibrobacter sp. UWCM]MBO6135605.1 hypothetical protein [Fibrobacter sp.]MBQ3719707.1 hypothetical protein [Fibrobacter sp.]SHH56129.1 hypothetical protein SAMN05720761_11814 [Fibrobacter sp. UWCM]